MNLILNNAYKELEFDKVLKQIAGFARSNPGRQLIADWQTDFNTSIIKKYRDEVLEGFQLQQKYPDILDLSLYDLEDVAEIIHSAEIGEVLEADQLRLIKLFLQATIEVEDLLRKIPVSTAPALSDMLAPFQSVSYLLSTFKHYFNDEFEVRDNASPELRRIREDLRRNESDTMSYLRKVLTKLGATSTEDYYPTVRNDRFAVALPRVQQKQVKGLVVDVSGGGNIMVIEPEGVLEANTERIELLRKEMFEVHKILLDFSRQIARDSEVLRMDYELLITLDIICAKVRYSTYISGVQAEWDGFSEQNSYGDTFHYEEPTIELQSARHPLIRNFVPEDLIFSADYSGLIISGVNAGGKTVLLKIIGLTVLLNAIGCFVPARYAKIGNFAMIFTNIGDDQSTQNNLSTFTAHLRFVREMIDHVTTEQYPNRNGIPLVIIDEIGTGTEPTEGAAFAYGVVNELTNLPVKFALTTHYDLLKTMAVSNPKLKNVSLEFDTQKLKPTYRIIDNRPGMSYALDIAAGFGIEPSIIETAKSVMGNRENLLNKVLGSLEQAQKDAEQNSQKTAEILSKQENELDKLHAERKKTIELIASLKQEYRLLLDKIIDEARDEIKTSAKITSLNQAQKYSTVAKLRDDFSAKMTEKFDEILQPLGSDLKSNFPDLSKDVKPDWLKPGGLVLTSTNTQATIIEIADKEALISLGHLKVRLPIDTLRPVISSKNKLKPDIDDFASSRQFFKSTVVSEVDQVEKKREARRLQRSGQRLDEQLNKETSFSSAELDLHGYTQEESAEALDKYLSEAVLHNITEVKIIHGIGTGVLRRFCWGYLKKHPCVSSIREAGIGEGGKGTVIVRLQ